MQHYYMKTENVASNTDFQSKKTTLTSYHYYNEMENRETADLLNAKELISHIDALKSSVVKFSSINIPPSASCESPKSFQNVRDTLYLGIDCPVIVTENTQKLLGYTMVHYLSSKELYG